MSADAARYPSITNFQPIIEAIVVALRERKPVTLPGIEGHTLVVTVKSATNAASSPRSAPRGLDARQLRVVDGTINEKLAEPISVLMLSSLAGLSRSHFSHAFRASVGQTPHAHIIRLRIDRAMKLMAETDLPMSEISLAVGFSDQAHFSNKFRQTINMTPTHWRRLQRSRTSLQSLSGSNA